MKVLTRTFSPINGFPNRLSSSEKPPANEPTPESKDSVEITERRPFLNSSTLLRAAKWGAIGAAAGALPFIIGAKAGGIAATFAAGKIVDALADNREGWGSKIAWLGVGTALAAAAGVGGTYIGMLNDGFALNQVILGATTLGAFTTGLSLAGDAVEWSRS